MKINLPWASEFTRLPHASTNSYPVKPYTLNTNPPALPNCLRTEHVGAPHARRHTHNNFKLLNPSNIAVGNAVNAATRRVLQQCTVRAWSLSSNMFRGVVQVFRATLSAPHTSADYQRPYTTHTACQNGDSSRLSHLFVGRRHTGKS